MSETVKSTRRLPKIVGKAKEGDTEAFQQLFEVLNDRLFAYALSHTGNRDDALDVTQDTFIELWTALGGFEYRNDEEFYGFVFLILKRRIFRYYRKKRPSVSLDEEMLALFEIHHKEEREDYRHLLHHINILTKKYQDVLRLHYWCGLKLVEIAALLEVNESTIKIWHFRALKELRLRLKNYEY